MGQVQKSKLLLFVHLLCGNPRVLAAHLHNASGFWFFVTVQSIVLCLSRLHAWGDTLEEAFEQCVMAMFGYMTDTETVEPVDTVEVEAEGKAVLTVYIGTAGALREKGPSIFHLYV